MKTHQGHITKSTGSWFHVKSGGKEIPCKIRGTFRIRGIRTTNPVAVGDKVEFHLPDNQEIGVITRIEDRKNYIIRKATKLSHKAHIIAANIDQAVLVCSMVAPETDTVFIDRFLASAEAYRIPARLIFNKIDLYSPADHEKADNLISVYHEVGYPCHKISALSGENMNEFKTLLQDKVSVISGHSGVGKSTLINYVEPGLAIKTAEISEYHQKGKHTTTFAQMYELSLGGRIIDTPGIKAFGLVDVDNDPVAHYFPEMFERLEKCRFPNCTHTHEPGCAVKQALDKGEIAASRYHSYLNILEGNDKYRTTPY